jgi:hypothetical protein
MKNMDTIMKDHRKEWEVESKKLAIGSATRIWMLASVIIPFFSLFEYSYNAEQFRNFLFLFLCVSCLMVIIILLQKKIHIPSPLQIYGVSIILATCFSYMASKTDIQNVHNYLMGVSAITLVRGMLYFGKVIHLIIVTIINHAMAISFIVLMRNEPLTSVPQIGSTLFFGIIFMIFSFAGMNIRYKLTKENFEKSLDLKASLHLIELQKDIVEEKQKEILDSIHYAKRIQKALITSEKYIEKELSRLKSV